MIVHINALGPFWGRRIMATPVCRLGVHLRWLAAVQVVRVSVPCTKGPRTADPWAPLCTLHQDIVLGRAVEHARIGDSGKCLVSIPCRRSIRGPTCQVLDMVVHG